ncbi:MAG: thioredoxin family protein [Flavobacteriaceae bacterium]|nr:thioredoxin family protein [Flavobacteriaceae bacterium]
MKKFLKYAVLALLISSATSCYTEKKVYNRVVDTEKYGKMLLGRQTISQFSKEPFSEWYSEEYMEYEFDPQVIKALQKNRINSYEILVFLGSWCGDTHRELPRLIKILDAVKYPQQKLQLIALNRKMEAPSGEDMHQGIKRVPTIIVKRFGKEYGRIVETPQSGSIEQDLLDIIKKK